MTCSTLRAPLAQKLGETVAIRPNLQPSSASSFAGSVGVLISFGGPGFRGLGDSGLGV